MPETISTIEELDAAVRRFQVRYVLDHPDTPSNHVAAAVAAERTRLFNALPAIRAAQAQTEAHARGLDGVAASRKVLAEAEFVKAGGAPHEFEAVWAQTLKREQSEHLAAADARQRAAFRRRVQQTI